MSMFSNVFPWLETTLKVKTITSALHIGQIYVSTCPNELPNSKGMHRGRRLHVSFAEVWPYFAEVRWCGRATAKGDRSMITCRAPRA